MASSYDQDLFIRDLDKVLTEIREMLIEKNAAYGDSALSPVRVFSKADVFEQLKVRMDDKLSRISRGHHLSEDVIKDLIGYLFIYRIQQKKLESKPT